MPLITVDARDISNMTGLKMSVEEIASVLTRIDSDVDHIDGTEIRVEFFPDRPDLLSSEGVARAVEAYVRGERGPNIESEESSIVMNVEESVMNVRPFVTCALVKDVTLDSYGIKSIMDLQEKLHITHGRKRKKVSIGIHDYDRVKEPFRYFATVPESVEFVPLASEKTMNLREIIREHDKGVAYGHLLERFSQWPLITDADGDVLSFPPVINGRLTTVTEETKNIFIDVTGTDWKDINVALNIVVMALHQRGGKVYSCELNYPESYLNGKMKKTSFTVPFLNRENIVVSRDYALKLIGIDMDDDDISLCLNRMDYDVKFDGENIIAYPPPWRAYMLHPVDVVEDIATGYGYENLEKKMPSSITYGNLLDKTAMSNAVRDLFVGAGFMEIMSLALSSSDNLVYGEQISVKNAISVEYDTVRDSLIPSLMKAMEINKRRDLPQKVFEIGYVVDNRKNVLMCATGIIGREAGFTAMKGYAEIMMTHFGIEGGLKTFSNDIFIPGRAACVMVKEKMVGIFGEIKPEKIVERGLSNPVSVMEFNLELMGRISGTIK